MLISAWSLKTGSWCLGVSVLDRTRGETGARDRDKSKAKSQLLITRDRALVAIHHKARVGEACTQLGDIACSLDSAAAEVRARDSWH